MSHEQRMEEIRSKVAKMTNEKLCTLVVDHAQWYMEYGGEGVMDDDAYYAIMTEVIVMEEAASRLKALDNSNK